MQNCLNKKDHLRLFSVVFAVAGILITTGCKKTPLHKSCWKGTLNQQENVSPGYDKQSGIQWLATNDSTHLFITFQTSKKHIHRNVFLNGVRIYLDTTNKKKKSVYLEYPHASETDRGKPGIRGNREGATVAGRNMTISMPSQAVWVSGEREYFMDLQIDKTNFICSISLDSTGFMDYSAGIPIRYFLDGGHDTIPEFSVAISIAGLSQPASMNGVDHRGNPSSVNRSYNRSGMQPGSVSHRAGNQTRMPSSQGSTKTEIWFKTRLSGPSP